MTDAMVKSFTTEELKALAVFLWLACRKIRDAKIRGLYGGPNADHASRDDESAGKAQSIPTRIDKPRKST